MSRYKLLMVIILLIVISFTSCNVSDNESATPTREMPSYPCDGALTEEFTVLNSNPCLQGATSREVKMLTDYYGYATQYKPEFFTIISKAVTVEGYPDAYSDHAPIFYKNGVYVFDIFGINGEWGFELPTMVLNAGCKIMKVTGSSNIGTANPADFFINAYIRIPRDNNTVLLSKKALATKNKWERIWVFDIDAPLTAALAVTVQEAWNSAYPESQVSLYSIFIGEAPVGYCVGAMEF